MHQDTDAKLAEAIQRRRAVTFLLPELASGLAGPVREGSSLEIDFDENWFSLDEPDRLGLKNVSDRTLTNCTLQVEIRGVKGTWVRNVHFVPTWEAGKVLWADYASSDVSLISSISGTTASEVQDVRVTYWAVEESGKSEIHYPGPARDADRLAQLDRLVNFQADYVAEPFFEHGPCIGLTLGGVSRLRGCRVKVLCQGGGRVDQRLETVIESWQAGARISLQSQGALDTCPRSLDVEVTCDGMEKGVTKTLEISRSR